MARNCMITARMCRNQRTLFRLAESQYGFTQKAIHLETGMSLSAIGQYARGETAMSGPAIYKLASIKDFPSDVLSILLDGTDRHIVDGEEEHELDDLGDVADDVAREVRRACHPSSPGGTDIVSIEEERIKRKARKLRRKAEAA